MTEDTRTLTVSVTGATDLSNMKYRFHQAIDTPFAIDVQEVNWLAPELPGEAAGVFELEVKGHAEAMKIEAEWMLPTEFDNVQVTLQPTEEEREAAIEDMEEYIDSLPASELRMEDHKVDS
jgi:hypothetical protein